MSETKKRPRREERSDPELARETDTDEDEFLTVDHATKKCELVLISPMKLPAPPPTEWEHVDDEPHRAKEFPSIECRVHRSGYQVFVDIPDIIGTIVEPCKIILTSLPEGFRPKKITSQVVHGSDLHPSFVASRVYPDGCIEYFLNAGEFSKGEGRGVSGHTLIFSV